MPNARDAEITATRRILMAGPTGSGKTSQIWTLPGRKFAYIFDPNSLASLIARPPIIPVGCDLDYELFLPEISEVDMSLKGFNKNSKDDKPRDNKRREPTVYNAWEEHINKMNFEGYDWLIIDSGTFLTKAVMDRQLYLNARFGGTEEIADYKIVGAKLADVFSSICASDLNIYFTAHLSVYQDDKTKAVTTELALPGRAKSILPLQFTDIFLASTKDDREEGARYVIRTRPDPRGLQSIRTSIPGLETFEDVTIESFGPESTKYGIGALLQGRKPHGIQKDRPKQVQGTTARP
jgi:hypothetical protein